MPATAKYPKKSTAAPLTPGSVLRRVTALIFSPGKKYGSIPAEDEKLFEEDFGFPMTYITDPSKPRYVCIANKFDEFKEDVTRTVWVKLPNSVIGTLIYFLVVEHNDSELSSAKVLAFIRCFLLIGFPTFMIYFFQIWIIWQLWLVMENSNDNDELTQAICSLDFTLQVCALSVFLIFIGPTVIDCGWEGFIILASERAAYTGDADEDTVTIHKLKSNMCKRFVTWALVCLIECLILIALIYVGGRFIISSDGADNVIINSVAICFVMDIDNMAREVFQSDALSEQIDAWEFDTCIKSSVVKHHRNEDVQDEGGLKFETDFAFWAFTKSAMLLSVSFLAVYVTREIHC